jgi:glycosyltransferase involved in cell wall biosynthesis
MKPEDITLIVPTRDEQDNIITFLNSLPDWLSLIVVDASQDATAEMIISHRPERSLLLRDPGNVSQARQVGAIAARTPWLLYSDADVEFAPDYFERLLHYRGYDVVYGPKLSKDEFAATYRWVTRGQQLLHWLGVPAASGSNLLISRHALFVVGGFDTTLACNEDSELVWRARRRGYPVAFAPDLVVYARDHRRLQQGRTRKILHSIVRCLLLFSNLMPARWRRCDWGYWSHSQAYDR